ncbi:MAG: SCO family protein [Betaproteobacteria bacterium]|nr:SCO family protein [Betaproteobacteria bacterium]
MRIRFNFLTALMVFVILFPAPSAALPFDQTTALRASQAVVGETIPDYTLLDRNGRPVRLSSYRGKPLLVSFIYTGCFQICPATTRALLQAVKAAQDGLGSDHFNVISIGFNQPADSPQALKSFAAQNGIHYPNWEFLSPPASMVASLTHDFGFSFAATPAGFDHIRQVTVVDAQGRIYRQIYGESFAGDMLGEPLRQLITDAPMPNKVSLSAILERVRILCTVYDPVTGEYRVKNGLALEVAGGLTFLIAIAWFFLLEWRAQRKSRRFPGV